MAGEAVYLLVIMTLIALFIPLFIYYLVQSEHDQRKEMDREDAERAARRDTHED